LVIVFGVVVVGVVEQTGVTLANVMVPGAAIMVTTGVAIVLL
jgi:hypothetical protein